MRCRAVTRRGRWGSAAAALLLVGLVSGVAVTAADGSADSSPPPDGSALPSASPAARGWMLVWSDEFDGPAGARPDPATWGYDVGDGSAIGLPGWGNLERQWYTDSPDNAALDGAGNLVLTARETDGSTDCYYGPCEFTSARLLTKGRLEVQYGRLEARIRVPGGTGLWPAFWMLGTSMDLAGWPASGEIDVMEFVGRRPTEILGTLHGPGYSGSSGFTRTVDLRAPVADEAHTVAIEWQPGRIVWLLDGAPYLEATPADVAPNAWVFDQPFFLLLNIAVGGSFGGPVAPETIFPASMSVDYVRLYRETDR
jgi:beta-glucanase (GH16 family)